MLKSAKAKVDELLARESHHLQEPMIHNIHTAMEVPLYGAEMVTTSKRGQFPMCQNTADKRQPYGEMLIGSGQLSDWSANSIRSHLQKASFSIKHYNIMSDIYCRMLALSNWSQKHIRPKTHPNENYNSSRDLQSCKHDYKQLCAISSLSIRY
jgi:hypothetical protein